MSATDLFERAGAITAREPLVFDGGPAVVRRVAIVSGGGSDYLGEAAAAGADALLTGEVAERDMAQARERGMHLIAAGHYATETFGIRALGEHLAERFACATSSSTCRTPSDPAPVRPSSARLRKLHDRALT